jgi:hypothetical protein
MFIVAADEVLASQAMFKVADCIESADEKFIAKSSSILDSYPVVEVPRKPVADAL